mgnify:CR=1 FL=1
MRPCRATTFTSPTSHTAAPEHQQCSTSSQRTVARGSGQRSSHSPSARTHTRLKSTRRPRAHGSWGTPTRRKLPNRDTDLPTAFWPLQSYLATDARTHTLLGTPASGSPIPHLLTYLITCNLVATPCAARHSWHAPTLIPPSLRTHYSMATRLAANIEHASDACKRVRASRPRRPCVRTR